MKMFFLYYAIVYLTASLIYAENVNEFSLKESICQQIAIDNKLARENVNFIGNELVVNSKQSPVDLHCIASDREIRIFKYKGPTFLIRDVIAPESKIVFLSIEKTNGISFDFSPIPEDNSVMHLFCNGLSSEEILSFPLMSNVSLLVLKFSSSQYENNISLNELHKKFPNIKCMLLSNSKAIFHPSALTKEEGQLFEKLTHAHLIKTDMKTLSFFLSYQLEGLEIGQMEIDARHLLSSPIRFYTLSDCIIRNMDSLLTMKHTVDFQILNSHCNTKTQSVYIKDLDISNKEIMKIFTSQ